MAKLTLLEIVQDIANDLDTDEINSINDTVESQQISQIIKTTYFEMIASRNWPHLKRTIQLEASGDNTKPTHIKIPELVKEVIQVSYNKRRQADIRDKYEEVRWIEPEDFLIDSNRRISSNTNVDVITDFGGVSFNIRNDTPPTRFTSFDDEFLVFDSYDNLVDTTIQTTKTQVLCYVEPVWTATDTAIPDLPPEAFPALIAEAKSTAFEVLRQAPSGKAEQKAQRQHRWLSRKAWKAKGGVRYPDYGRRKHTRGTTPNPLLEK